MDSFTYKYDDLFNPTLEAIRNLGGSASVAEIEAQVSKILRLSEEAANDIHRGSVTKLAYRLAWSRNYLKRYGLLENSSRGVWALTKSGLAIGSIDKSRVKREVRRLSVQTKGEESEEEAGGELGEMSWQGELLEVIQRMQPDKFERLCQRLLRELGFVNVEVTGRTGDGGIDGRGTFKWGGILAFPVLFQCKRYQGSVSAALVREFKGAISGRVDKGLFITTGAFTREAKKEAEREGTPPIDLMDGVEFVRKLRELQLGVSVSQVEKVSIKREWFAEF